MSFKFETRTCTCGSKWEALDFWSDDAICHDCASRDHQQMIDAFNTDRPYRIESIGGACPTQAEGEWIDGQRFYFRARHGKWLLHVDPVDAVMGAVIADGDDETHGNMAPADVVTLLDAVAAR